MRRQVFSKLQGQLCSKYYTLASNIGIENANSLLSFLGKNGARI